MDPHPMLPAAEGWQPAATAPQTATWVQLGYPPQGYRKDPPIVIAHWASDMSGEEQPGYEGWFRDNLGHGGKSSGFVEVPTGWVAWRPLWPDVAALRKAIEAARIVFDAYALSHQAKGTPDGDRKAATNADLARQMRQALEGGAT